jgi:hypothetical protein
MSNNRAVLRRQMEEEIAELKSSAITKLENRGYEVRGKTTAQIRLILKRHPTKPLVLPHLAASFHFDP